MTRVLSYNILAGGYSLRRGGASRVEQLAKIIRGADPDIVGLVEATNNRIKKKPSVIEELAEKLNMQLIVSENAMQIGDFQVALLTRLPVIRTQTHVRPGVLNKSLLEVCVEEANGEQLTVFVTHLLAGFNRRWAGEYFRRGEVREILRIMSEKQGTPHLLMGDFNSLAPSDQLKASILLRYIVNLDKYRTNLNLVDGHPHLNAVVPYKLRFLKPILRLIPQSKILSWLFDMAISLYVRRKGIRLIYKAGYVDCFRRMNPDELGFTCPASAPSGRIDYIFASPELGKRLTRSKVAIVGEDGFRGDEASDHLAMFAEFGEVVSEKLDSSQEQPLAVQG